MRNLLELVDAAKDNFRKRNPASLARHEHACQFMPGGNTRSVLYHQPFPLAIERGEDASIWDVDGHRYTDFLGDYTSGLYGHSNKIVISAIEAALAQGLSLSGHNLVEAELAELLTKRFPSLHLVRFTNSGTEANMMAVSAAQHFTGRSKILVFSGGYHGGTLSFVGPAPLNVPFDFVIGRYNDIDQARELISKHASDLAAVLVEPLQGAGGCIPGDPEFLTALREETLAHDALLIFDEVMTSRFSLGGRQEALGIIPDMSTLGKYFGGGLSFGAFGGRTDIMQMFDPRSPKAVAHSGTFNNNTLSMAAGVAGAREIITSESLHALNTRGEALRTRMNSIMCERGVSIQFTGIGSLFTAHATEAKINRIEDLVDSNTLETELLYFHLIERNIYIARRGMFALMLPITDHHCAEVVEAISDFATMRQQ